MANRYVPVEDGKNVKNSKMIFWEENDENIKKNIEIQNNIIKNELRYVEWYAMTVKFLYKITAVYLRKNCFSRMRNPDETSKGPLQNFSILQRALAQGGRGQSYKSL